MQPHLFLVQKTTGSLGLPVLICWFISQSGGLRYFGIERAVKITPNTEKTIPAIAKSALLIIPAKARIVNEMQTITILILPAGWIGIFLSSKIRKELNGSSANRVATQLSCIQ